MTADPQAPSDPGRGLVQNSGPIWNWFGQPWVGVVGTICSAIGIVLSIWFYYAGHRARSLSIYVNPVRTTIVKSGRTSELRVFSKDQEIKSDVSAVQLAIWNGGREPIKPEHVLSEIRIKTQPAVPILEATLRNISRSVTKLGLDTRDAANGSVTLNWRILEYMDGCSVQIVYLGGPEVQFTAAGTIEGQHQLHVLRPTRPPRPISATTTVALSFLFSLMLALGAAVLAELFALPPPLAARVHEKSGKHPQGFFRRYRRYLLQIASFVITSMIATYVVSEILAPPPFIF
jgi:hypothetical protein